MIGTTSTVNATCDIGVGNESLKYVTFEGADHVPTLYAGQQYWLRWIKDRFNGVKEDCGCMREALSPDLPLQMYQAEVKYYLESPLYAYETA